MHKQPLNRRNFLNQTQFGLAGIALTNLLSDADLALRGQSGLAGDIILEVLVARLSYLYLA